MKYGERYYIEHEILTMIWPYRSMYLHFQDVFVNKHAFLTFTLPSLIEAYHLSDMNIGFCNCEEFIVLVFSSL